MKIIFQAKFLVFILVIFLTYPRLMLSTPYLLPFFKISSKYKQECKGEDQSKWNLCYKKTKYENKEITYNYESGSYAIMENYCEFKQEEGDLSYTYKGQCTAGQMTGYGKIINMFESTEYVGQVKDGRPIGYGRSKFDNIEMETFITSSYNFVKIKKPSGNVQLGKQELDSNGKSIFANGRHLMFQPENNTYLITYIENGIGRDATDIGYDEGLRIQNKIIDLMLIWGRELLDAHKENIIENSNKENKIIDTCKELGFEINSEKFSNCQKTVGKKIDFKKKDITNIEDNALIAITKAFEGNYKNKPTLHEQLKIEEAKIRILEQKKKARNEEKLLNNSLKLLGISKDPLSTESNNKSYQSGFNKICEYDTPTGKKVITLENSLKACPLAAP